MGRLPDPRRRPEQTRMTATIIPAPVQSRYAIGLGRGPMERRENETNQQWCGFVMGRTDSLKVDHYFAASCVSASVTAAQTSERPITPAAAPNVWLSA